VNPYDFSGIGVDDGIILSWRHPVFVGTYAVRLLRSEKGYPRDPFDGQLIYEGVATAIKDYDVVAGKRYFYTLFSVLETSYSSGVITSVLYQRDFVLLAPEGVPQEMVSGDIMIIQNQPLVSRDNVWRVLSHQPISIIVTLPPETQKVVDRVIISFSNRDNLSNSYLLSWHQELNGFTAEIDPESTGPQSFMVQAYDRFGNIVYKYTGELIVDSELIPTTHSTWWPILLVIIKLIISVALLCLGLLTFIGYLWY
jgi:hypothetical protein